MANGKISVKNLNPWIIPLVVAVIVPVVFTLVNRVYSSDMEKIETCQTTADKSLEMAILNDKKIAVIEKAIANFDRRLDKLDKIDGKMDTILEEVKKR